MYPTITLALLAHAGRQDALADFALDHRSVLSEFDLVTTPDLVTTMRRRTHLPIRPLQTAAPGAGGSPLIGQLTREQEIQAVIFFRDPRGSAPSDPDFGTLLNICDCQEIPLATNPATAEALLYFLRTSPDRGVIAARSWGRVSPPVVSPPSGRILISSDLQSI